ncbi:uncharacterized protein LOC131605536 [Vicia villosa]|uniref:uncharacterized protein LOC131605536 n=1 Tax=Vicia villosa TaxID=3911 RepID=UPI00273CBDEA|nr:uncharacterized protein LOC131605536 [Vicia villosa]
MRDGNNALFYAYLKTKQKAKSITMLRKMDRTTITNQIEFEQEILDFHGSLMGAESPNLAHIDVEAMRKGKQLSWEQREFLQSHIIMQEIENALKGIGNLKSPGIDGYGAKFFKSSWSIIKEGVAATIQEFFDHGELHRNFNKTVVTLIRKSSNISSIKDYRHIDGCTTF